jgi:L-seryl-tRNA(Ser) seleniumtransferase
MSDTIYDELGVPTVINGAGTKTRLSGTLMRDEAIEAMRRGAETFARISDLQAKASEVIADATGAEAGYVTSGAGAGLVLGAAACIAGKDPGIMHRLPDTEGVADEIVMPRSQRNGYDHAIRAAGATIVDIGETGYNHGCASTNVEPWEITDAISEDTVAVSWLTKPHVKMDLETVVEIAHEHDVPVIVDAAPQLPPATNLRRFIDAGADLVVFSGGKAIRGPQTTGILAGRADLIESAALQHLDMHVAREAWVPPENLFDISTIQGVPRQGVGRPLKVGKEEICGLIAALEAFIEEDHDRCQREWTERVERIAERLDESSALDPRVSHADKTSYVPSLVVHVDEAEADISTASLVRSLREENPRVYVGGDHLHEAYFSVNPMSLTDEEADYLTDRVLAVLDK